MGYAIGENKASSIVKTREEIGRRRATSGDEKKMPTKKGTGKKRQKKEKMLKRRGPQILQGGDKKGGGDIRRRSHMTLRGEGGARFGTQMTIGNNNKLNGHEGQTPTHAKGQKN